MLGFSKNATLYCDVSQPLLIWGAVRWDWQAAHAADRSLSSWILAP